MAFIYDAEFTVHSVIDNLEGGMPDGEPEINITTLEGFLKLERRDEGDVYYITYGEKDEYGGRTVTDIKIDGARVELSRRGAMDYNIVFEEGKSYSGIYAIPPYKFDMTVLTKKIRKNLSRTGGELQLIYSMNVGGGEKACRMKISVKTKK